MIFSQANCKRLLLMTAFVVMTSTSAIAQTNDRSGSTIYEDPNMRVTATGASFDRSNFAQVSLILENKSGKDLFLAAEFRASRVISDSGETSECQVSGIKDGYWISTKEPKPLQFSRIKSKAKISVSVSNCQQLTSASKPVSVGVSLPLLMLENEEATNVTVSLTGIPINYKSKKAISAIPQSETIYFRTPSNSIHCALGEKGIGCQVNVSPNTIPPKPKDCQNEWGGRFSLGLQGKGYRSCYSDTLVNPDSIVLKYDTSIESRGITCTAKNTGLTCTNNDRKGWELSRDRQRFF
jgi:hypothetical protein